MSPEDSETVRAEVAEIDRNLAGLLESCTLPILREQHQHIVPSGTGTLLRIGDGHYICTAAHIVTNANRLGAQLLVGGVAGRRIFGPRQQIIWTPTRSLLDIAAWRLDDRDVTHFSDKRFLTLDDLWLFEHPALPGPEPFVLHGYLEDWAGAPGPDRPVGHVNPARAYMGLYKGTLPTAAYRPEAHLLFRAAVKFQFDKEKWVELLPHDVLGLSGGGVVRVSRNGHHQLVGIGVGIHGDIKAYQATRTYMLIRLIGTKHIDARETIERYTATANPGAAD